MPGEITSSRNGLTQSIEFYPAGSYEQRGQERPIIMLFSIASIFVVEPDDLGHRELGLGLTWGPMSFIPIHPPIGLLFVQRLILRKFQTTDSEIFESWYLLCIPHRNCDRIEARFASFDLVSFWQIIPKQLEGKVFQR